MSVRIVRLGTRRSPDEGHSNFSVGCYCEDESHCHRSVLRALLKESGAKVS